MLKIYLIICIILSISCKPENKGIYEFDPRILEENKIPLSEIADEIFYIPIDNPFPLGTIHPNFVFLENSILFTVRNSGILEFGRDGKFIRRIGRIGRGPGEYVYYYNFTVNEERGIIYVLDRSNTGSPIKVYSSTGVFQKSISLQEFGENISKIAFYNSNLFAFKYLNNGDSGYNWVVFDTLGNIIRKKERTIPMFRSGWSGPQETYNFDNNLGYWETYNDTVYTIMPDFSYKAALIVSPGDHRAPRAHIPDPNLIKNYLNLINIFETRRFVVINYSYKIPVIAMIDKNAREAFVWHLEYAQPDMTLRKKGGIENDLDGGIKFQPQNYFEENGNEYMVDYINPYQIKTHIATSEFKSSSPKYPEKKKELVELANSLKETDNPVLILVRLKK